MKNERTPRSMSEATFTGHALPERRGYPRLYWLLLALAAVIAVWVIAAQPVAR